MSKILKAVKKTSGGGGDFSYRLATVEGIQLFPPPSESQQRDFDLLANSLINIHDGIRGKVVTFTSTARGEGVSYVSYNLARHLAYLLGRKICWVDANFKRPQQRLQGHGVDFRSLLQDPDRISQVKTGSELVLIPNGDGNVRTTDLLTSDRYTELLDHFADTFYFTILDAPPILESVDVGHLAAPTEGAVVVIESRRLKYELVQHGLRELRNQRVTILGTVLNKRTFDLPRFLYEKL